MTISANWRPFGALAQTSGTPKVFGREVPDVAANSLLLIRAMRSYPIHKKVRDR
jgi:hypothetical protein